MKVSGDKEFEKLWTQISEEHDVGERNWIAKLRSEGFTAAHPNDGWVDCKNCIMTFVYPQFCDGIEVGSKVMLGQHWDSDDRLRPITIIKKIESTIQTRWEFRFIKN